MSLVFNPPPNWPKPPSGWVPPPEWRPDPAWGPPPSGWALWIDEESEDAQLPDKSGDDNQRIFISYRRTDCQAQANGVYDGLGHRLKDASLFMDIDSIPPGVDFEDHIRDEIKRSDVVLVMIGDNWLDSRPGTTRRRIDETDDFVRLEIETALASRNIRIIPVLVEGAQMPSSAELPESIHQLARLNAFELSDHRWTSDVERLARTVEGLKTRSRPHGVAHEPRASTISSSAETLSAAPPTPTAPPASSGRRVNLVAGTTPSGHAGPPQQGHRRRGTAVGWVLAFVPLLTCGFGSFAPALWARSQRAGDLLYRRRMLMFAIVVGLSSIGSFILIGVDGADNPGSEVGPLGIAAVGIWFGAIVTATVVAVLNRKPALQAPGSAEHDQRRRRRAEYRRLINTDITLARSMSVGRPDLQRSYDDGGLLDLNSLSVEALVRFGVPVDEAASIVKARQVGRFSTLDEVALRCNISRTTVARLRETAVFL
jgi:TIR domain